MPECWKKSRRRHATSSTPAGADGAEQIEDGVALQVDRDFAGGDAGLLDQLSADEAGGFRRVVGVFDRALRAGQAFEFDHQRALLTVDLLASGADGGAARGAALLGGIDDFLRGFEIAVDEIKLAAALQILQ